MQLKLLTLFDNSQNKQRYFNMSAVKETYKARDYTQLTFPGDYRVRVKEKGQGLENALVKSINIQEMELIQVASIEEKERVIKSGFRLNTKDIVSMRDEAGVLVIGHGLPGFEQEINHHVFRHTLNEFTESRPLPQFK